MKEALFSELYNKESGFLGIPEDIDSLDIIESCKQSIQKQIIEACMILDKDIAIKDISLQYVYWSARYDFSYTIDKDIEYNNIGYFDPDSSSTVVHNLLQLESVLDEYYTKECEKEGTLEKLFEVLEDYHPKQFTNKAITFRTYEKKVLRNATCFTCMGEKQVECIGCAGKGRVPCTNCKNGKVKCSSCNGSGKKRCSSCFGGETTCSLCGGTGRRGTRQGYNGNTEIIYCSCRNGKKTCSTCGGSAKVKCNTCNGGGEVKCPKCGGSSFVTCLTCGGSGKLDCQTCKATGSLHDLAFANTNYTTEEHQLIKSDITDKYPIDIEKHRGYYEHVTSTQNDNNTITKCYINRVPILELTIVSTYNNKEYKTFVHGNDFIIHDSEEVYNLFSETKLMYMKKEISSISLFSLNFRKKAEEQLKTYITTPKLIRGIHKTSDLMSDEEKVFYEMIKRLVEKYYWHSFMASLLGFFTILALASLALFSVSIASEFTPINVKDFSTLNSISVFAFIEIISFIFITWYILSKGYRLNNIIYNRLENIDHNLKYFAHHTLRQSAQKLLYFVLGLSFVGFMVYIIATQYFEFSYNTKLITSLEPLKLVNALYPEFRYGILDIINSTIESFVNLKGFIVEKYNYFISNR